MDHPRPSVRAGVIPLIVLLLTASAPAVRAADVSGRVIATTDYIGRGNTVSDGEPSLRAHAETTTSHGLYATGWLSTVDLGGDVDANLEADYGLGWRAKHGDWKSETSVVRYFFPRTAQDVSWSELRERVTWRGRYWLMLGWSPDALASGDRGLFTQIGAHLPLNDHFEFIASVARYDFDRAVDDHYNYGRLSGVWSIQPSVELRLTATATSDAASRIYGQGNAGDRVEIALAKTF